MNQNLRRLIFWVGGTLFLLLGVVVVIPLVVHPNEYRAPIAALVKNVTGRTLTIQGDVGLTLFPNVGMVLRDVSLANAPEFGPDPMAQVTTVEVEVKFMPLLSGRVEVEQARMLGLSLFLHRNGAGLSNWDDLSAHLKDGTSQPVAKAVVASEPADVTPKSVNATPVVKVAPEGELGLKELSIGGVDVVGARLYLRDESTERNYKIDNLDVKIGRVQLNRPIAVTSGFSFSEESLKLHGQADMKVQLRMIPGQVSLEGLDVNMLATAQDQRFKEAKGRFVTNVVINSGSATVVFSKTELSAHLWTTDAWLRYVALGYKGQMELDLVRQRLLIPKSLFTALIQANALPPAGVQVQVTSDLIGDWQARTLQMEDLLIEGPAGIRMNGAVKSEGLLTVPVIKGNLSVARFDFRTLLIALGRTIPASRDDKVYSGADVELDFLVSGQEMEFKQVNLGFDESRLTGNLTWNGSGPSIRFDGEVDRLDVDHYLPLLVGSEPTGETVPKEPVKATAKREAPVENALATPKEVTATPLEWLTPGLLVNGQLMIGQLVAGKGHFKDVKAVVTAKEGQMTIDPLSLALYEGQMEAKVHLDGRDQLPKLTLDHTAKGVQAGPLLQEMAGVEGVTGQGDWVMHLLAQGRNQDALTQSLNGDVRLVMADGVIPGLDVVGRIRKAYATFKRVPLPASTVDDTQFSALTATATLTNGVLDNQDLLIQSPVLLMNGAGQVDFVQQRVDYQLKADVATALQGVVGDAQKFQGMTLPLHLRSSFDSIKKFDVGTVDFSQLATNALRERVMDRVGDKLGEEEKEKINRGLDRLEQKLGEPVNQLLRKFGGVLP